MLAQVLNRDFTLGTVAATEKQLRSVIANRRAGILGRPDDPREIPTDELEELADALAGAFAAESAPADGPRPAQPGEQAPPPKSDYAYVPGNPVVGLVQVALEAHAAGAMDVEERTMDDDRRGGPLPVVTDRRLAGVELRMTGDGRRLWGRMEVANPKLLSDPGWLRSVASMIKRRFRGTAPFVDRPGAPPALAGSARIVLVGDWGSGLPRAKRVAAQIAKVLDDPAAGGARSTSSTSATSTTAASTTSTATTSSGRGRCGRGGPTSPPTRSTATTTCTRAGRTTSPRSATRGSPPRAARAGSRSPTTTGSSSASTPPTRTPACTATRRRGSRGSGRTIPIAGPSCSATTSCSAPTRRAPGSCGRRSSRCSTARRSTAGSGATSTAASSTATSRTSASRAAPATAGSPSTWSSSTPCRPPGSSTSTASSTAPAGSPWNTFGFAVLDVDGPRIDVRFIDEDGNEHYRTALP